MSKRFSCPPLTHSVKSVDMNSERRAFYSWHRALFFPSSKGREKEDKMKFNLPTLRSCPSYEEVGPGRSYDLHRWV
jgi:hypothetical protein